MQKPLQTLRLQGLVFLFDVNQALRTIPDKQITAPLIFMLRIEMYKFSF